ncbi:MAG: hypothetical protein FWG66_03305 [Spirochaetes bacterium]|nr:hypothetical protein [Spirochaetota bacterium]
MSGDYNQKLFFAKIRPYEEIIDSFLELEKKNLTEIKEKPELAALLQVALANDMLNLASNYLVISGVSEAVMSSKNAVALDNARKSLYKSIIYLEKTVTNFVDAPFSDYEEKLAEIDSIDANKRYFLIRKMGLTLELVKNAYGRKSRWRWPLVEMEGRFAAVAKNIINLRKAVENRDPRSSSYEATVYHTRLVKRILTQAAYSYHEKFEFNSSDLADLRKGINLLYALRRFNIVLGDRGDAEELKKKLDKWNAKYDNNQRKGLGTGS